MLQLKLIYSIVLQILWLESHVVSSYALLERTYKPHYHYQNLSPLANGRGLNRQKYAILQTHWH